MKSIIRQETIVIKLENTETLLTIFCNLRYKTLKEIPVILHNGSTCDYYLILKELAKEFEGSLECLGENTEKYITFSVPIKKQFDNGVNNYIQNKVY